MLYHLTKKDFHQTSHLKALASQLYLHGLADSASHPYHLTSKYEPPNDNLLA
ncbi:TPA: hypothetical protein VE394_001097 [Streptococcus pyogenes]|nr:hypothetical protein HMPREF1236_0746 [Streptococcus pyogenes GA40056]ESU86251.1 hypothetical protein HMPREF1242_0650 [Streptococcus pyogenes GA40884]HEQ2813736.1 hypothetical protein [Streptococcus pyogenes]